MNTLPGTANIDTPIAKSMPVTQNLQVPKKPVVSPHVRDILEPSSNEQAIAAYLERQMQNMSSVRVPSSMPSLEDGTSIEPKSLSKRVYEYCQERKDNRKHKWQSLRVTLDKKKESKRKQHSQQDQEERDPIYAKMLHNVERTRTVVRNSISRASTFSAESKYRILYWMLQQASKEQTSLLSPEELASGMTPSLAALDDAPALRQREWRRGEPGENIPCQYSTTSGHLTPTPPSHENMRMDTSLNVTQEGSLDNLPAAVSGVEENREGTHPISDERPQDGGPSANIASTEETPETHLKVAPERQTQAESPRRIERTREASREDTIASTRHFFVTVNR